MPRRAKRERNYMKQKANLKIFLLLFLLAVSPVAGLFNAGQAYAADNSEKLLMGFEKADVEKLKELKKVKHHWIHNVKEVQDGWDVKFTSGYSPQPLLIRKSDATEGQYSVLSKAYRGNPYGKRKNYKDIKHLAPDVYRYYRWTPFWRISFGPYRFFRKFIEYDWSGHSFFRFDVKSAADKLSIRVMIEDEDIDPPIMRIVEIPKGKWVTVEVDLDKAVKIRGLDLKKILNFCILVEETSGGKFSLDNIRIGKKGSRPKLSVVKDSTPMKLPEIFFNNTSPPGPRKNPVKPDRTPLKHEKPIVIDMADCLKLKGVQYITPDLPERSKCVSVSPVGFIGAYDNRHMLLGFTLGRPIITKVRPSQVLVKETNDGGRTWNIVKHEHEAKINVDHGSSHGSVVDGSGDCIFFSSLGCGSGGGWVPYPRFWSLRTFFTGKKWKNIKCLDYDNKKTVGLADCEARHCISSGTCIRLKNGRLWASWGYLGRLGYIAVAAKYSDDNGTTWRSWREGKTAIIPGSMDKSRLRYNTYNLPRCGITYYKDHVAVIWSHENGVFWSYFDGKAWSDPVLVDKSSEKLWYCNDLYVVTQGDKDIFVTAKQIKGILHWDGKAWKKEVPGCTPLSPLAVAGGKVFAFSPEKEGNGFKLVRYKRSRSGQWDGGKVLVTEKSPLSRRWRGGGIRKPIVVQPYSPPNFIPVAWATENDKMSIKVLRVPAD